MKIAKAVSYPIERNSNDFSLFNSQVQMEFSQDTENLEEDSDIWQQIENINFLDQVTLE